MLGKTDKLRDEELHSLYWEDEMGWVCSTYGRDEKCTQNLGRGISREETPRKT